MKNIYKIRFNWYATNDGDEYKEYEIGKKGVLAITEHSAGGDGDKWYYEVWFQGDYIEMIFNPNTVFYKQVVE